MNTRFILKIVLCLLSFRTIAQDGPNIKFGKITPDDFKKISYSLDSNANAVVIADIGSTEMQGSNMGSLNLEYKRFRRVHILNKNAYDVASVEIPIYTNGHNEEELKGLKAVTYNLVDGKVVETELDKSSGIFKDNISKNLTVKKFTFPNIKEGCIIEYEYKIISDYIFNIQPWLFQGQYPCLWSEYKVSIPEFYYFVTIGQGYQQYFINTKTEKSSFYAVPRYGDFNSSRPDFSAIVTEWHWAMKDVPALKAENFTSTIMNHLSSIEFQLSELRYPFKQKDLIGTWPELCKRMLQDENFGYYLNRNNGWLNDDINIATKGANNDLEKAKGIYTYLRDRMNCTGYNGKYMSHTLKEILNSSKGSAAEINLLLTAMMIKAGFNADPIMISTRSHGYIIPLYPLLNKFNYVISRVNIDGRYYYLDASHPRLGFGKLTHEAYNGQGVVVNETATPVQFEPDSVMETKVTSVVIINDDKGNLTGTLKESPGSFESYEIRDRLKQKGSAQFISDLKKNVGSEVEMATPEIDSVDRYDDPISIQYDFDIKNEKEDILYFNPMFTAAMKENPLKSAQRLYPIEMPNATDEVYLLKLDVPTGYTIDELPKPIMLKLNDNNDGYFEYAIVESDGVISLRSRIRLSRTVFPAEEYVTLREFYNMIVKKHSEQIVFKKKK